MGNVHAAGAMPSPPMQAPPPMPSPGGQPAADAAPPPHPDELPLSQQGPGTFEDLHKKCKDVFPVPFEGAKFLINKGLSNHFQLSHTLTMSTLQPSGYRFGCTYVGTKQFSPMEAYPILIGEIDASGNVNANIIHHFTRNLRCKFVSQIQGGKWQATQATSEWLGKSFTASVTCGNPDLLAGSGILVSQYLQSVTKRLDLGTELLYQRGPNVPGNQIAIYTLAARYAGDRWQLSGNLTPMAGGLHLCYQQQLNDGMQVGAEFEGSLRTQECTATVGYSLEVPSANITFRGQADSNFCVGAVMEKKLLPLPFTFIMSAFANHVKETYRFGMGLVLG